MKRKFVVGFVATFLLFGMTGLAQAALTTIGTATYNGSDYNLIWDDNSNGNSVVWLDYTKSADLRSNQMSWAANLDGELTYNIDPAYTVDWGTNSWRLPTTRVDHPGARHGYEGDPDGNGHYTYSAGFNLANSEMGHLFYTELGNLASKHTDGSRPAEYGLRNTGEFENLSDEYYYISSALYGSFSWTFNMSDGRQVPLSIASTGNDAAALTLRTGQVSAVPIPAAAWLLGSGLVGLVGVRRKLNK